MTHHRASVDIATVGTASGLSLRSLQRRFLAATGDTPSAYLRKLRLQKACEALETTRKTVEEIVWEIGYEDPSAFRTLFKHKSA